MTATFIRCIIRERACENPTLVALTDRNDLDDQLFGAFSRCSELLRQPPVQAKSRARLRRLLRNGRQRERGLCQRNTADGAPS